MPNCPKDDALCQSSSAFEAIADSLSRLYNGDWSHPIEDGFALSAVVGFLIFSWYFAMYSLKMSLSWERARERRSQTQRYLLSIVLRNSSDEGNQQAALPDQDEVPQNPIEQLAQEPEEVEAAAPADFRAAGDGWENDDDIDYIVDEDLLVPGRYSDEDSDDDRVVLRQIIMTADDRSDITPTGPNDERQIAEVVAANLGAESARDELTRITAQNTTQEENHRANEAALQNETPRNNDNTTSETTNNLSITSEKALQE